ncbi:MULTISPECIES: IS21-like element helper ATPase IstB [unclassified Neptuniibacter]|uniref:IS21-like element helper ATPase IstB n=1 Tax=unclassified Neptuniibacter TaxID=2630693 RepID=UPI000C5FCFE0|nr:MULTISPECIES: IS21-like element helper ATPase IstB [unclassified Neptuniibacter]MAY42510.1 AAA family ATPase [Oceanospirillaceae bacterium]|tara:strand:+ start:19671 stop:20423 length:753 start_codon:yes stop_codon:yes gene_type:complete
MLTEPTMVLFQRLKLTGMQERYEELLKDPASHSLSHAEVVTMLLEAELHQVERRRLKRLLRSSRLKQPSACIEDIDYRAKRGLNRTQIMDINALRWVDNIINIILTGETGTGKTWLACAWSIQCIRKGIPVLYYRLSRLLEEMEVARGDGSLPKLRTKIGKALVLVLDDWGVSKLTARGRQDLLEIIEDRTGSGSVMITSQLPIEKWHSFIGEPTIADAILDRLVHNAYKVPLKGESMRKRLSKMKEELS